MPSDRATLVKLLADKPSAQASGSSASWTRKKPQTGMAWGFLLVVNSTPSTKSSTSSPKPDTMMLIAPHDHRHAHPALPRFGVAILDG